MIQTESTEQVPRATNKKRNWLVVSYDITNDKRRAKIMKTLEGYGRRVQYSVFECELRPGDIEKLKGRLRKLIDPKQDDIRFYPLCESCLEKVTTMGKARLHRHADYKIV